MKLPRRRFLHLEAGAATLPVVSRNARAQGYPTRPVRIVVPYVFNATIKATISAVEIKSRVSSSGRPPTAIRFCWRRERTQPTLRSMRDLTLISFGTSRRSPPSVELPLSW